MKIAVDFVDEQEFRIKNFWQWVIMIAAGAMVMFVILATLFTSCARPAWAGEISDTQAIKAIMGEASNQGYQGMLAVAVGIRNRGTLQGVYGLKAKHIYKEPRWVWDLAGKAWQESKTNRIHSGTHWENIKAFGTPYWVKKMILVYSYKDHNFYRSQK